MRAEAVRPTASPSPACGAAESQRSSLDIFYHHTRTTRGTQSAPTHTLAPYTLAPYTLATRPHGPAATHARGGGNRFSLTPLTPPPSLRRHTRTQQQGSREVSSPAALPLLFLRASHTAAHDVQQAKQLNADDSAATVAGCVREAQPCGASHQPASQHAISGIHNSQRAPSRSPCRRGHPCRPPPAARASR